MKLDLKNETLAVGYNDFVPYTITDEHGEIESGIDTRIVWTLAQYFNFSIRWVSCRGMFGARLTNGSWNGMMRQVIDKELDLALASSMVWERRPFVLYFYPHWVDRLTFVTNRAKTSGSYPILYGAMNFHVWLCLFLSFLSLAFVQQLSNAVLAETTGASSRRKTGGENLLIWIRLMLNQTVRGLDQIHISVRICVAAWIISGMFLTINYCGYLFSMTAVPRGNLIDTVDRLAMACRTGYMRPIITGTNFVETDLRNSRLESFVTLARTIKNVKNYDTALNLIRRSENSPTKVAFITSRERIRYVIRSLGWRSHFLYMAPNHESAWLFTMWKAIMAPRSFRHFKPFDWLIQEFRSNGMIIHWRRMEMLNVRTKTCRVSFDDQNNVDDDDDIDAGAQQSPVSEFNSTESILTFYLTGMSVSFVVFISEQIFTAKRNHFLFFETKN